MKTHIREWRDRRKLSPTELAYKSGMSASYLYTLEKQQKTEPQFGIIDGLSRELGVPIPELFDVEITSPDERVVFLKFEGSLSVKQEKELDKEIDKINSISSGFMQKCIVFIKDIPVSEEGIQFFRESYIFEECLKSQKKSEYLDSLPSPQKDFYRIQFASEQERKSAISQMREDVIETEKWLKRHKISFERFYRPVSI